MSTVINSWKIFVTELLYKNFGMEDIQKKAFDDELNKSNEEIGQAPKKFVPVPKRKKKENEQDSNTEASGSGDAR